MFVISKNSLYRGLIPYILLSLLPGRKISFVISRTSLNRGSLNRGSTVVVLEVQNLKQTVYIVVQKYCNGFFFQKGSLHSIQNVNFL